jgi:hypothetical protein
MWWEEPKEGEHLEDRGVDEKIILRCIFMTWEGGIYWIDLVQQRNR